MNEYPLEFMLIMLAIMAFCLAFVLYLYKKQLKVVEELKIGDKIVYQGCPGEILDKTPEGKFIIKIEASGLMIVKDQK